MSYHTIILAGNLGADPSMRYTPNGQAVTNFSVAVNDNYTNNNGEKVERTIWVRVSAWGKQAEACNQYLKKGSKVLVEGRLSADASTGGPRIWQGKDGSSQAQYEVSASTVRFLSERSSNDHDSGEPAPVSASYNDDDNIPF